MAEKTAHLTVTRRQDRGRAGSHYKSALFTFVTWAFRENSFTELVIPEVPVYYSK